MPYDRPPLSKAYLVGKLSDEQIRLLPAEKLAELDIDVQLGRRAVALDLAARQVTVADGSGVDYGRLVVATGARPVLLPQFEGMSNVHVLREAQDARRLRESLVPGTRLGIVGAGFIGLEIAATALGAGCDVTLIELSAAPLAAILGAELGTCIQRWHERKGIRFHCGTGIASVRG